jgi:hypothetical protein
MDDRLKEIVAFREAGHSYGSIASRMGLSRGQVSGSLWRAGLTNPDSPNSNHAPRPKPKGYINVGSAKLSESDVRYIRAAFIPYHRAFGASALARVFNVSASAVWNAANRKAWAHVQ